MLVMALSIYRGGKGGGQGGGNGGRQGGGEGGGQGCGQGCGEGGVSHLRQKFPHSLRVPCRVVTFEKLYSVVCVHCGAILITFSISARGARCRSQFCAVFSN